MRRQGRGQAQVASGGDAASDTGGVGPGAWAHLVRHYERLVPTQCQWCGLPLPVAHIRPGRPRLYCRAACVLRAFRQRRVTQMGS